MTKIGVVSLDTLAYVFFSDLYFVILGLSGQHFFNMHIEFEAHLKTVQEVILSQLAVAF